MTRPRICILRAPGTNCDLETAHAFDRAGGAAARVHLLRVLERPERLDAYDVLCIPGGFSYGDDIGAGAIFSQHLAGPLASAIERFLERNTLVLGICNGFQVLLKAGLLPGGNVGRIGNPSCARGATLTWNENGKYTALWVRLKNTSPRNAFLRGIDEIELPVAHAEGRFVLRDPNELTSLTNAGHIALSYIRRDGTDSRETDLGYPDNPNGSLGNVAALSDASGRVLGLMPHPERWIDATQHPRWTRDGLATEGEGMAIFRNAIAYFSRTAR